MTNREIYTSALSILAQSAKEGDNEDYEERAPYIIANFLCDVADLDRLARKFLGMPEREDYNEVWQSLDSDFPFIERFASAASKYLAAMLVLPDDEDLFERLYNIYCECISRIKEELPSFVEKIVNKYM